MTPEFIEAVLDGRLDDASDLIGAELPEAFPRQGEKQFLELRLGQMRKDERFLDWCPFVVVLGDRMIGHAGYHGPPGRNAAKEPDAVEFGYTIEPDFRGRGYATDAAAQLLQRAEARGVTHFVLSCAPANEPSLAVIRKLGFVHTGEAMDDEDGLELVFELQRSGSDPSP
jgi:[ribosomal protein S5]-alanine N-acetyltransferase